MPTCAGPPNRRYSSTAPARASQSAPLLGVVEPAQVDAGGRPVEVEVAIGLEYQPAVSGGDRRARRRSRQRAAQLERRRERAEVAPLARRIGSRSPALERLVVRAGRGQPGARAERRAPHQRRLRDRDVLAARRRGVEDLGGGSRRHGDRVAGSDLIEELAARPRTAAGRIATEVGVGAGELLDAVGVAVELDADLGAQLVVLGVGDVGAGFLRACRSARRGRLRRMSGIQNQRLPEARPPHSVAV